MLSEPRFLSTDLKYRFLPNVDLTYKEFPYTKIFSDFKDFIQTLELVPLHKKFNKIPWTILEPNPSPVPDCTAKFIKGFFDQNFIYTEDFDTIIHSHVFEHIYNPNDICRYHVDGELHDITKQQTLLRYASVVIHLNTVTEGGELVFPNQNKSIKTEEGKLVVFPPYGMYGHYTTPSNQVREVIVSWFVYDGLTVNKNI
jgi:hypothetical protein